MCVCVCAHARFLQFHVHVVLFEVDDNRQCDETEAIVDYYLYDVFNGYNYDDYHEKTAVNSL